MKSRKKDKISTDAVGDLANNPFAGLDVGALPVQSAASKPMAPAKVKQTAVKSKGRVEVRREKAGRGGKTVTTLREFPTHIPLGELDKMTYELKKTCACGGTLKGRVIELQGDVRDRVIAELSKRGYQPVRAGG